MDMEQAAFFLSGCILVGLGLLILIFAVVLVNNVLYKYWKPVKIFTPDSWKGFFPPHSIHSTVEETKIEPKSETK
jgi:hypothetical protein